MGNGPYLHGCPSRQPPCIVTSDRNSLSDADAVVWNARWMRPWRWPPYRKKKRPGQRWVLTFFFEAVRWGKGAISRDVTRVLAPGVDWTMTYFQSSDFFQPM